MPREKNDPRKTKIMIRISNSMKKIADTLAKEANENTSTYLRQLLYKAQERNNMEIQLYVLEQQKYVINDLSREFVKLAGKKARG
jgi:hypothetical protein